MGFMVICLLYCTIVDADGRLTGPDAVKFFSRSQLSRGDLKQVLWLLFLGTKEREREVLEVLSVWKQASGSVTLLYIAA
jgi:hypothetical protein